MVHQEQNMRLRFDGLSVLSQVGEWVRKQPLWLCLLAHFPLWLP